MEELKKKGKAYANRRPKYKRPKGDLYHSPKSIFWKLMEEKQVAGVIWECACGDNALLEEFPKYNIEGFGTDIDTGFDFLNDTQLKPFNTILINPPFSLFDEFIMKAKEYAPDKIIMLGRTNYLGTHGRNVKPEDRTDKQKEKYKDSARIWEDLKTMYVFDRMIDYQTPKRTDGMFHVGNMVTCWYVFEKGYVGDPTFKVLDLQEYATLGGYKEELYK